MSASRRRRGRRTELDVAAHLCNRYGAERVDVVAPSRPGADVTLRLDGIALAAECKARRNLDPRASLAQAQRNAGADSLGVVVVRLDGAGPATLDEWPVLVTFGDLLDLLDRITTTTAPAVVDDTERNSQ